MILGLNGLMRAGKDTVAARLAVLSPVPVVRVSYAAKLKESVAKLLDIDLETIERWKNDPDCEVRVTHGLTMGTGAPHDVAGPITFRHFLQRYGTESHRNTFGEAFWLDAALPLDKDYSDALYVVTDMRFVNEAARVKELGGVTALVIGPEGTTGPDGHVSETILPCELRIRNEVRDDGYEALDAALRPILLNLGIHNMGALA
jgi:hypothetical protein